MKKKLQTILFVLLAIMIFSTQVFGMGSKPDSVGKLRIGAILPLTGPIAFLGDRVKKGMSFAHEALRKKHHDNIEIIYADSKGQPKEAVSISKKFINIDKVDALIVFGTSMVNAVIPIAENSKTPLLAQTIYPKITENRSYVIQHFGGGSHEWNKMGEFLNSRDVKKIVVFRINALYGEVCFKILRDTLDTKDITNIIYDITVKDFNNLVIKHKKQIIDSDMIVMIGYPLHSLNIAKTIYETNITNKTFIGTEAFLDSNILSSSIFENSLAVVPNMFIEEFKNIEFKTFVTSFESKFKEILSFEALYGYLNTMLLSETGKNIETKLNDYSFNPGIGQNVPFTKREAIAPVSIGMIRGGKIFKY